MKYVILDCYTDEASGLGVPPYLGTYPRYLFGQLHSQGHHVTYLTIDDLRLWKKYGKKKPVPSPSQKTNILVYNTTVNDAEKALATADVLVVILGVHVPGKYLTAQPGTLREVVSLIKDLKVKKVLSGPAFFGTQLEGGKVFERTSLKIFDEVKDCAIPFEELERFALSGVDILKQIPDRRVLEIETGRGCRVGKCSFCTEPLKARFTNRKMEFVVKEVKALYEAGARYFRLGKQADFFASDCPVEMLKRIRESCPGIEVLHIDNVNPVSVVAPGGEVITKAIVKYCTPGNVAAFGVESFDPVVVKANFLNTTPSVAFKAIRIINKHGSVRGDNGMPKFLPGINLVFGLIDESKSTHEHNMKALNKILGQGLLLRRINVRQAAILPGTFLHESEFRSKHKRWYWKWRNDIRQEIDFPMLQKVLPVGTVLRDVWTEMYDGKTTFCRQLGTYPLVVGVKGRLPLKKKIDVKVTRHMLRSIVAEVV